MAHHSAIPKAVRPLLILIVLSLTGLSRLHSQTPAFPGAEGFGKYATGGRGGAVVAVTNIRDTGVGSFRWALEQFPGAPLTVVFRVSGVIDLQSEIKLSRSFVTIAGQTAPGDGICLKGNSFIINGARVRGNAAHIVIRYLRFRPGSYIARGIYGLDMENCHDVIIDHCSFSWANEENAALYDTRNTTVQWCISSEGLYHAGHHKGDRSYSGVWGGQFASYHHNLIAHCNTRTVRFNGSRAHDTIALVDYRNNVVYNSRAAGSCYGGEVDIPGGRSAVNMISNYYKPGPVTPANWVFINASYTPEKAKGTGRWHLEGNRMEAHKDLTTDNYLGLDLKSLPTAGKNEARSDSAFAIPAWAALTTQTAEAAYQSVLAGAGASLPKRDAVDSRIATDARNGTAKGTGTVGNGIIDDPAVVGGWPVYHSSAAPADTDGDGMPDSWEKSHGLDPNNPADRNGTDKTGYTNLELYLNSISSSERKK